MGIRITAVTAASVRKTKTLVRSRCCFTCGHARRRARSVKPRTRYAHIVARLFLTQIQTRCLAEAELLAGACCSCRWLLSAAPPRPTSIEISVLLMGAIRIERSRSNA